MERTLTDPIARKVAEYLLDRPQACDSAAGIRTFWLLDPVREDELLAALDRLCELEVLRVLPSPGAEATRYRLAMSTTELVALLDAGNVPPPRAH